MWLSSEDTTVLDNALVRMEYLYKTGRMKICLRRLINEQSYFEIRYTSSKTQAKNLQRFDSCEDEDEQDENKEQNKSKSSKLVLSMEGVDDHKRQLTFCNTDLQESMVFKKILLNEQLNLLKIIENIYTILIKIEMAGHPQYQLRDDFYYDIYDRTGKKCKD